MTFGGLIFLVDTTSLSFWVGRSNSAYCKSTPLPGHSELPPADWDWDLCSTELDLCRAEWHSGIYLIRILQFCDSKIVRYIVYVATQCYRR
jgi:hypothetical protein